MTDTIERFSNRVANYVKYRPGYPRAVIEHLTAKCGLTRDLVVADVGCGPGQSSRMFLENGNPVIGVEPNEARLLVLFGKYRGTIREAGYEHPHGYIRLEAGAKIGL